MYKLSVSQVIVPVLLIIFFGSYSPVSAIIVFIGWCFSILNSRIKSIFLGGVGSFLMIAGTIILGIFVLKTELH